MTTTSNAIATPAEHDPAVTAQSPKSYEDLMRENARLRVTCRQAEAAMQRIVAELDLMVAKCNTLAKGAGR